MAGKESVTKLANNEEKKKALDAAIATVSYTHLDVYKRQTVYSGSFVYSGSTAWMWKEKCRNTGR